MGKGLNFNFGKWYLVTVKLSESELAFLRILKLGGNFRGWE